MSVLFRIRSFISHLKKWNPQTEVVISKEIKKPPQRLIDLVGGGDYFEIGNLFFNYFLELGNLKPNDRVLDIGCGVGRMALPLTKYLNKQASYEGFDIVKELVDWSKSTITPRYPNFHFQHSNVFNYCYNPTGKVKGSEYKFPFTDNEFDFTFLTSVFTHMLPMEMENYLAEISRTLKPGGRCFITYFILNESVLKLIMDKKSTFQFNHNYEDCHIDNPSVPEAVVGYDEEKLKSLFVKYAFDIDSIHYGNCSGRPDFLSFQDIVILVKS